MKNNNPVDTKQCGKMITLPLISSVAIPARTSTVFVTASPISKSSACSLTTIPIIPTPSSGSSTSKTKTLLVKLNDGSYGHLQVQQHNSTAATAPKNEDSINKSTTSTALSTNFVPVFLRQIRNPNSGLSVGVKRTAQDRRDEIAISNTQRIFVVQSPKDGLSPTMELVENAIVDDASLQSSMKKNTESLKRKLMSRPSRIRLIQQGILPDSSTPPRFHEQKVKLERARMGDVLKHKMEHRPDKQQLVSQHILLCDSSLDPNVQEKQRQLKKCKLADSLNDKLAHRPGPLELVQENILHVDEALEQAVKDGRLQFKPTSAGMAQKHPNPVFVVQEMPEEPQSSEDGSRQTVMIAPVDVPTDILSSIPSHCHSAVMSVPQSFYDSVPISAASSMSAPGTPRCLPAHSLSSVTLSSVAGSLYTTGNGSSSNSNMFSTSSSSISGVKSKPKFKKPKSTKTVSHSAAIPNCVSNAASGANSATSSGGSGKSKIIKFHEYKGPSTTGVGMNNKIPQAPPINGLRLAMSPNGLSDECSPAPADSTSGTVAANPAHTSAIVAAVAEAKESSGDPSSETSYELLLHQQQLFLQWQLELQQKYPNSRFQLLPMWTGNGQQTSLSFSAVPTSGSAVDGFASNSSVSGSDTADSPASVGFVKQFVIPTSLTNPVGAMTNSNVEMMNGVSVQGLFSPASGVAEGKVVLGEVVDSLATSEGSGKKTGNGEKPKQNSSKPPVNPTKLEDLRVCDLKAECKKRNLPVSGPKPNLLEKLKPYAEHIIENWKNPVSDISEPSSISPQMSNSAGVVPSSNSVPPIQDVTAFLSSPAVTSSGSFLSIPTGVNGAAPNYSVSTNSQLRAPAISTGSGHGPGFLQASPAGSDISRSLSTDTSGVASNYSSPGIDLSGLSFGASQGNGPATSNCFTFAAGGSGGQFTPLNTTESVVAHQAATCETPPSRIDPIGSFNMDTSAPPSVSIIPPAENSPRDGELINGRPQSQMGTIFTTTMSATTLSVHEEMLRHQQRKIEELQKELQRSQEQLKHQQQVILAARKAQNEKTGNNNKSIRESEAEAWLANIDTKHLQKFHIQQFLQHKLQQQQLQQNVALQAELAATQRRLQEELGVEQAVSDVGRMIKQDPRAASLMVYLLKKYHMEKKEEQQNAGEKQYSSVSSASNNKESPKKNGGHHPPASVTVQAQSELSETPATPSTTSAPTKSGAKSKNRNSSGSKKAAATRSNSMPTSPAKAKCSLSGADMEEIFKSVLDLASKAAQQIAANSETKDDGTDLIQVEEEQTQKLPSCDQLIPSLRNGSELVEDKMPEETVNRTMDDLKLDPNANHSLGSLLMNNLPSAMDMLQSDPTNSSFVYTKNEAFEDLLEVLRNNGGEGGGSSQQLLEPGRLEDSINNMCYPNTFGTQDLNDLLGNDWLENSFSQSQEMPNRLPDSGAMVLPNQQKIQDIRNGDFAQDMGFGQHSNHGMPSVHSEPNLQHSGSNHSGGSLPSGFDLGSSLENGEQMDWLDLILPSPAGMELPPTNPPGGDSGFLGSDHEDHGDLRMTPSLATTLPSYTRGGSGNPVLAQNTVCHNRTDAFDLGVC